MVSTFRIAAQLAAEADKPPNAAPAGRAGSVQRETDGVTPLADAQRQHRVHRGKRRAARPLARVCGLQLNV